MPLPTLSRAARDERGFTLIELLVVIAIIGALIALVIPAVELVGSAATSALSADSPALRAVARSSLACADTARPILTETHRSFALAQASDTALTENELTDARDAALEQLDWVSADLAALRELYPELSRSDKRLARELRRPLEVLEVELRRVALLIDALRVSTPPEDR